MTRCYTQSQTKGVLQTCSNAQNTVCTITCNIRQLHCFIFFWGFHSGATENSRILQTRSCIALYPRFRRFEWTYRLHFQELYTWIRREAPSKHEEAFTPARQRYVPQNRNPLALRCWHCPKLRPLVLLIGVVLTFWSLAVSFRTTRFNIQKFYMVIALRWVFCTDTRTDSDFCFIQH